MAKNEKEKFYEKLPETPGVYLMKDAGGRILYIGKAGNLRRRVSSYFTRPQNSRMEKMVSEIKNVGYKRTDTALEALILESELIKKHNPPFNVREKDDKSFLHVEITKERFPRVLLVRGKDVGSQNSDTGSSFGPFTSASNIREALRIIRRIFPFGIHPPERVGKFKRPCFDYEIGLCPGTCLPAQAGIGAVDRKEYLRNIRSIKLIFQGKKKTVLKNLEKEMKSAGKKLEFESAAKIRRQIFALRHIQDVALISESDMESESRRSKAGYRIEGYDISNISGSSAVGAMVVFHGSRSSNKEYRLFKIRTVRKSDDVGMLKEAVRRRLGHSEWPLPDLILVDGGKGQVNAVRGILDEFGLSLPVVGIAKGAKRKKNEFIGVIPGDVTGKTLIKVRDEAHRFAQSFHRKLRSRAFL